MGKVINYISIAIALFPRLLEAVQALEGFWDHAQMGKVKKELVKKIIDAGFDVGTEFFDEAEKWREFVQKVADRMIDIMVSVFNKFEVGNFGKKADLSMKPGGSQ